VRDLKEWIQRSGATPTPPASAPAGRSSLPIVHPDRPSYDEAAQTRSARSDGNGGWIIEEAPFEIQQEEQEEQETPASPRFETERPLPSLAEVERDLIKAALERFNGNRRKTAETLGISERTLYRKLKEYELVDD